MRTANQKLKLLYILKMLWEYTDENNYLTMNDIISRLAAMDINAERKSVYTDIDALNSFGFDIRLERIDGKHGYLLASRDFEEAELKLLVDAVQSSKFITRKKSRELIRKLETLGSRGIAKNLQRQVYIVDRVKSMNESIYYNIDAIHSAINNNVKVKFKYMQWQIDRKLHPRRNGEPYIVSPFSLLWQDENYYLIAFDSQANKIKHYRVDKMEAISLLEDKREGKKEFAAIDIEQYTNRVFSMYSGDEQRVNICFNLDMIGVVIDRFGKDIDIVKVDEDEGTFEVSLKVSVSNQFFGWLLGLDGGVRIVSPEAVVEGYKELLKKQLEKY